MKKILLIATVLLLYGCRTGYIEKELKSNLFDKFNYELWKKQDEVSRDDIDNSRFVYRGMKFYLADINEIYIYPQKQQFYTIYNTIFFLNLL